MKLKLKTSLASTILSTRKPRQVMTYLAFMIISLMFRMICYEGKSVNVEKRLHLGKHNKSSVRTMSTLSEII